MLATHDATRPGFAAPPGSHLRKRPTQARSRRTVEAILQAADRVLQREGYEAASTNRLAHVAGYSVGSLYQYFADKESVVRTLLDEWLLREEAELARHLTATPQTPASACLAPWVRALFEAQGRDAHVLRAFVEHGEALYGASALHRVVALQWALPDAWQHWALDHWEDLRRQDPPAMLGLLNVGSHAVALRHAAQPPAGVEREDLVAVMARAWVDFLSPDCEVDPRAEALVGAWENTPPAAVVAFGTRLATVRAELLRDAERRAPEGMASAAFAIASLGELVAFPSDGQPGVEPGAWRRELRLAVSAFLRATYPKTAPGI